jgi:hydroxyacylglutathione hydrolase
VGKLIVHQFPCLDDNYGYLIHVDGTEITATIDTPDAQAIALELEKKGWRLTHILNTHWHPDHAGGNQALKARYGACIIAPADVEERIPHIDQKVRDGDIVVLGDLQAKVLDVPGHTTDHVAFWFESEGIAFVGDALFSLGCGRLFEGDPGMMWNSLSRLSSLPSETLVYCAHEYTAANAAFAATVEPENRELVERVEQIGKLRAEGTPTVPTTIGVELRTNPFLRPHIPAIRERLGMNESTDVEVFAELRARKDNFRG